MIQSTTNRAPSKLRAVLSVFGIVLSVVAGYNTWQQIDAMNAADDGAAGGGSIHSGPHEI
ncbi:hypothetical protein [Subtercola endophyticus]|uniref:hypothetical protein n=1 Tax=Subtercola endophyticus TaxID=2895559 RepID=UPI001E4BFB60|nr:hypothetical protein [Subtercola endophyticus]UFS57492.1 hypothetical protein LQ955_10495 [Subtercola endophyticus]